jgi:glutamate--cysteine ligase
MAAERGRAPGLELRRHDQSVLLRDWGREICDEMGGIVEMLDPDGSQGYADIIKAQVSALGDPALTPSARLIAELRETGQPMSDYGMELSRDYAEYFKSLATELNAHGEILREEVAQSIERQAAIEAHDSMNFEAYLAKYFE